MSGRCQSRELHDLSANGFLYVRCTRTSVHIMTIPVPTVQGSPSFFIVKVCDEHVQSITGWH